MQFITIAAAALLAIAPVAAKAKTGTAIVHNMCDFDVYLWSVSTEENPSKPHTLYAGDSYSEAYKKPAVGGVSIKLSNTTSCSGPITQFEYTLSDEIWYDLSNVNCHEKECPFQPHGMYMESGSGCPTRSCVANNLTCSGAYTDAFDDENSLCCAASADTVVYLCTASPNNSSGPASSGVAPSGPASSSAASAPAPSSSNAVSAAAPSSSAAAATTKAPAPSSAPAASSEAPVSVVTTLVTSRRGSGATTANVVVTKTVTTRVWGHRHTARAVHHPHARH